jgi:heme-degrading monooxygenase HmoA
MTVFNVVRFKIKPGMEETFLGAHRDIGAEWAGLRHANIIKTGDDRYCIIAEWESPEQMAAGRPQMIATLNSFRHTLEDLGGGLGVTDPVSGPVVLAIK